MQLEQITPVRFFRGDKARRAKYLRKFKGRWDNDCHFIRSAVRAFERQLDKELLQQAIEKKVKK